MKDSEQVVNCDFWLCFGFFYFGVNLVLFWLVFICLEQGEKCMSMTYCMLYFQYT